MLTFRNIKKFSTQVLETEALLKKLQTKPLVTLTRDNYQINMGLLIQRDPIYLYYTEQEMKLVKYRYQLSKKHNLLIKLPKEMHEYTHYTGENDSVEDMTPTHVRMIGDERTVFMENCKNFKYSDPNEKNNKLIQYNAMYTVYLLVKQNGLWSFPNINVEDKETFQETKDKFFAKLTNNTWEIYYFNREPRFVTQDEDKQGKIQGVKTYYFPGLHIKGRVQIFGYEDWCWASRLEMNKYFNEKQYNQVIHAMDL